MFGFIKRLFGQPPAPALISAPAPLASARPAAPIPPPPPAIILRREEIIDAKTRICGYRFLTRAAESAKTPDAPSTVAALALNDLANFAERRLAIIPIAMDDWQATDFTPLIGRQTMFMLTPPASNEALEAWSQVARQIQAAGASVGIAARGLATTQTTELDLVDYLLVDFTGFSLANFEQAMHAFKQRKPGVKLLIENIGRWSEFRYCIAQGASGCLGPFTTEQDESQETGEIAQSRLVLVEMLNKLRQDADLDDIIQIAKRDPGVVVKLVSMANSPLLGLSQAVTGIEQAIMVLGREQLYRWCAIGIFRAGSTSPRDDVLLELALARSRFLENIAQTKLGKPECDELFLLGLLSLFDSLFGLPMSAVIERIHVSPALREVLIDSSGPLGRYLMLAIAVEKGHLERISAVAGQLDFSLEIIESASREARAWAEEASRLNV